MRRRAVPIEMEPGQEREIVFILGGARMLSEARDLAQRFQHGSACRANWKGLGLSGAERWARSMWKRPIRR